MSHEPQGFPPVFRIDVAADDATEGAAGLMAMFYGLKANGLHRPERGTNMLDPGAHLYDVYETKDGKYVSIGSIEPQFYALLLEKTGLKDDPKFAAHMVKPEWPELSVKLAEVIATKTIDAGGQDERGVWVSQPSNPQTGPFFVEGAS